MEMISQESEYGNLMTTHSIHNIALCDKNEHYAFVIDSVRSLEDDT